MQFIMDMQGVIFQFYKEPLVKFFAINIHVCVASE